MSWNSRGGGVQNTFNATSCDYGRCIVSGKYFICQATEGSFYLIFWQGCIYIVRDPSDEFDCVSWSFTQLNMINNLRFHLADHGTELLQESLKTLASNFSNA